jgi:hypothetical protein
MITLPISQSTSHNSHNITNQPKNSEYSAKKLLSSQTISFPSSFGRHSAMIFKTTQTNTNTIENCNWEEKEKRKIIFFKAFSLTLAAILRVSSCVSFFL